MNKKTAKALEKSIAHWKRMYEAKDARLLSEEPTEEYCALCKIFYEVGCVGCPVALRAETDWCSNTPYLSARIAFDNWLMEGGSRAEWRKAARKEIKFLESLRDTA
jgi:hypothetical protein